MITIFFFGSGNSDGFIADRIQLNLNASQVEMGNRLVDALIYINLTTGAISAFLLHVINRLPSNLSPSTHRVSLILLLS